MEIYDVMPFADLKICGSKEEAGLRNNSGVNQCLMVTGRKIKIAASWVLPHARVARIVSLCRTGVKYIRKALPPLCACYDRDEIPIASGWRVLSGIPSGTFRAGHNLRTEYA
ncbi:hypothetical protein Acife_1265 [Acidithiobacillus ferrivorans SS3]|uniref:Uncharacterized protein n=1 Tax=Acidithiobacillus ferrivorans SS3 TaxID=743299 RepID=G0JPU5_9PROT|nr:hypothetical protein Acife_1265 [Acidithiobacillus ferrivorans SS3]OFA17336.1 hypothetical protein A4U49_02400 [Acidithiobacillus ferrivorans]